MVNGPYHNPHNVPLSEGGVLHWLDVSAKGIVSGHRKQALTDRNYQKLFAYPKDDDADEADGRDPHPDTYPRVSRALDQRLKKGAAGDSVELVLTFREQARIPLLPPLGPEEDREGKTKRALAIEEIAAAQKRVQLAGLDGLPFDVQRHFWIVNAVSGKTRLGQVSRLIESRGIAYIQLRFGDTPPPSPDSNPANDVDDARRDLLSDPYFNITIDEPEWIGLIDSGVRRSHHLLQTPFRIAWWRDTVNGGPNGNDSSAPGFDPNDTINHGTAGAAILSGTDNMGDAYRGLTRVKVDSWRVYSDNGAGGFAHIDAILHAIQAGLAGFEDYLVLMVQEDEPENGVLAQACDNAFDAGAIVIAANGNFGPHSRSVRSPAIAHKVLGVGAFDVVSRAQLSVQSRGPARDRRIKPDIQAPTNSETASAVSDTALRIHENTSGATPYAAGVAVLCHRWLRSAGWRDKGLVYAYMILYGEQTYPFDNISGAGPLQMIVNAGVGHGRFAVTNGRTIEIPVDIGANRRDLDAALWWPERVEAEDAPVNSQHSDVDLHIIDPLGMIRAHSVSATSVFERAQVKGPLQQGQWRILISGYSIPAGTQEVYFAASVRFG